MAKTTTEGNNKLIRFTRAINREFVKQNMYSPYMGSANTSIIRVRNELRSGGEQMNIPLVTRLRGKGKGVGTLVGFEEKIDNYGMRVWLDWSRHAVQTDKAEKHKDSADIFGEARPLLSDWGRELQRDEVTESLMALPSEAPPAALGSDDGDRVNGIRYESASTSQKNTWHTDNQDRVLYGNAVANYQANNHATSLAAIADTQKLTRGVVRLAKSQATLADHNIRPYRTRDGYEYFVLFAGEYAFRDLSEDMESLNQDARPRNVEQNPIFQDGDLLYNGVIIRKVEQISLYSDQVWGLTAAGGSGARVEPYFFCGQQTASFAWGQMARPTFRKEDDYGFIDGTGIEMAYGVAKNFKKPQEGSTALKQWGMLSGFIGAAANA